MIALIRIALVVAVATPAVQTACDGDPDSLPQPDFGEVHSTADGVRFHTQVLVTGLQVLWALAFAPDGRLFVTERPGRVRVVEGGQLVGAPALTLTDVFTDGEAGTMGLALDPDFSTNRFVYVLYTATRSGASRSTAWSDTSKQTTPSSTR